MLGSANDAHFEHFELWLANEVPSDPLLPDSDTLLLHRGTQAVTDGLLYRWLPAVADGDYVIGLRVRDRARNLAQHWQPLRIDAIPPVARIDAPLDGAAVQPQVVVTGSALDRRFHRYSLQLAGAAAAAEGRWSTVLTGDAAVEDAPLGEATPSVQPYWRGTSV